MSGFLLDTHVFFWATIDSPFLRAEHRQVLFAADTPLYVSAVTCFEISMKVRLGKWPLAAALLPDIAGKAEDYAFSLLPVTPQQAELAGSFTSNHRDPFDRLLAAQALDLDLTLLTVDRAFAAFGCKFA